MFERLGRDQAFERRIRITAGARSQEPTILHGGHRGAESTEEKGQRGIETTENMKIRRHGGGEALRTTVPHGGHRE